MRSLTGRSGVAALVALGALAFTSGQVSAAPPNGCAPSYDTPGLVTFESSLTQPRLVQGLATGAYTEDELAETFAFIDANGDGRICLKAVSNLRGSSTKNWEAFYLASDNRHPVK